VTAALLFGLDEIYARLPAGSLALGAPHEVAGGDNGAIDGAAVALFVAGIAARMKSPVVSRPARSFRPCPRSRQPEIGPVIYLKGGDEKALPTTTTGPTAIAFSTTGKLRSGRRLWRAARQALPARNR
jgi:hypothetical protein